jgi:hypothetical protein
LQAKIAVHEAIVSQLQSDKARLEQQLDAETAILQTLAHERAGADEETPAAVGEHRPDRLVAQVRLHYGVIAIVVLLLARR